MADEEKLDKILSTVTDVRIDTAAMKANLEQVKNNTTALFRKSDYHAERIAKVEVKAEDTEGTLQRHVADRAVHNGSSSHLLAQNGGWSTKHKTIAAVGGGSIGGAGLLYGLAELVKVLLGSS